MTLPSAPEPCRPDPPSRPRLRLRDVRSIFRLIGEVRELGADPHAWRVHLVRSMVRLLRAEIVVSSEIHFRATSSPQRMRVVDLGWGADADSQLWEIRTERDDEQPETYRLALAHPHVAIAAPEGATLPVRPVEPIYGGRCFILSQYRLPHIAAVDRLGLHRIFGDDAFTAAEHRLVRLFHVELGRLWRKDVLDRACDPRHDLPPRLKQTLDELLAGKSEKQIAAALHISPHTVHNYVKALHQRFDVSSRGELLARFSHEKPDFTPRLSVDPPDDAPPATR